MDIFYEWLFSQKKRDCIVEIGSENFDIYNTAIKYNPEMDLYKIFDTFKPSIQDEIIHKDLRNIHIIYTPEKWSRYIDVLIGGCDEMFEKKLSYDGVIVVPFSKPGMRDFYNQRKSFKFFTGDYGILTKDIEIAQGISKNFRSFLTYGKS